MAIYIAFGIVTFHYIYIILFSFILFIHDDDECGLTGLIQQLQTLTQLHCAGVGSCVTFQPSQFMYWLCLFLAWHGWPGCLRCGEAPNTSWVVGINCVLAFSLCLAACHSFSLSCFHFWLSFLQLMSFCLYFWASQFSLGVTSHGLQAGLLNMWPPFSPMVN